MSAVAKVQDGPLSLVRPQGSETAWWAMAQQQAAMLVKTGFLPQSIKTPEQALAIMMKGRELGVPPMYALSNIVIIQGKPTCNAELMLALVRRDHGSDAIRIAVSTNEKCTIQWRTWGQVSEYSFTIQDAQKADLLTNATWKKYPAAMLRARCISAVCRMAFPESIAGMYTGEELGAPGSDDGMPLDYTDSGVPMGASHAPSRADPVTGEIFDAQIVEDAAPISGQQKKLIGVLRDELGMTNEQVKQWHGKASANDLTVAEASALIDRLEAAKEALLEQTVRDATGDPIPPAEVVEPPAHDLDTPSGEMFNDVDFDAAPADASRFTR